MRTFIQTAVASIALAGAAQAATPIDSDTTLSADHAGGLVITADDVTLDCAGFTVQGDGGEAIGIDVQGHGVTLLDCVIDDFTTHGISAVDVDRLTILRAAATRVEHGVGLRRGEGHVVDGLYVAESRVGAFLNELRDARLSGLIVDGPEDDGVQLWRAVDSELSDSVVTGAGRYGVDFALGYRSTLRNVEVTAAADRGIWTRYTARSRVEGCAARFNGHNGFGVYRTTRFHGVGNTSEGNGHRGINLAQSTAPTLDDNITAGNGAGGFGQVDSFVVEGTGNASSGETPRVIDDVAQPDLGDLQ